MMVQFASICYLKLLFPFQICSLMRGGIAERGGVRVGHRIIEINGQSVVATAHEKIVQALSNSVGEVRIWEHVLGDWAVLIQQAKSSMWTLKDDTPFK